jgi:hypothetical protein
MTEHPIIRHTSIRAYLATLDPATTTELAAAAIAGASAAGALADWDSETIEHVLTPLIEPMAAAGLPPFCDQDEAAEATWSAVAEMPH